jgi:hypothetical protein
MSITKLATLITGVEEKKQQFMNQKLEQEQKKLNLEMGSQQLRQAIMANDFFEETLPQRYMNERLKLREQTARTELSEIELAYYPLAKESELEYNRYRTINEQMKIKNDAYQNVLEQIANESFLGFEGVDDFNKAVETKQKVSSTTSLIRLSNMSKREIEKNLNSSLETFEAFKQRYYELERKANKEGLTSSEIQEMKNIKEQSIDIYTDMVITSSYVENKRNEFVAKEAAETKMLEENKIEAQKQLGDINKLIFDRERMIRETDFKSFEKTAKLGTVEENVEIYRDFAEKAKQKAVDEVLENSLYKAQYPLGFMLLNRVGDDDVFTGAERLFGDPTFTRKKEVSPQTFDKYGEVANMMGIPKVREDGRLNSDWFAFVYDSMKRDNFDVSGYIERSKQREQKIINGFVNNEAKKQPTQKQTTEIKNEAIKNVQMILGNQKRDISFEEMNRMIYNETIRLSNEKGIKPPIMSFQSERLTIRELNDLTNRNLSQQQIRRGQRTTEPVEEGQTLSLNEVNINE